MDTRLRKDPPHIFELFCEIGIPPNSNEASWISWKYPYSFKNDEILKSVQEFSYPCEFNNNAVQHFSFVLTNVDSQWTFGFCRHAPDSSICYVILSFLPWHEVFYKILNHVAELSNKEKSAKVKNLQLFLENLYKASIPEPGLELHLNYGEKETFVAVCPDHEKLPSIPENRNITEYFNAIDAHNMMTIFASMLHERRILISSKKLSRLSACIQAANALIYPMHWQHIFIPVLPKYLSDYLSAPMPFLIGVPSSTLSRMKFSDVGDVVFLDADENKIESPFADLDALPSEVLQSLRHDLKHPQEMLGDAVARAFLKAQVKLIGGYWNALKLKPGEKITFSSELFVQTRPSAMQPFLQKMLELQIFQQFIDSRLKKLNSGQGVSDEFEFELTSHEDKTSFKLRNQYREWVSNMKVKDTGKKAYKDIRSKFQDIHTLKEEKPYVHKRIGSVPTSLSNGFESSLRKHHNLKNVHKTEALIFAMSKDSQNNQYSTLHETEDGSEAKEATISELESPQLTFQPIDMDLMGDLHEVIFRSISLGSEPSPQRTSVSNPQLIDLTNDGKNVSSGSSSSSRSQNSPATEPPPLLPYPTSYKARGLPHSSSSSSETSDNFPSSSLFGMERANNNDRLFFSSNSDSRLLVQTRVENVPVVLKPTNPFYSDSIASVSKSSSGSNVRDMIDLWQASSSPSVAESSLSPKKLGSGHSPISPYRSQPLSRALSTPPWAMNSVHPTPTSTNPFMVPEHASDGTSKINSHCPVKARHGNHSSWENFH